MASPQQNEFDVVIVGSGSAGATIARELSRQKKRVLLLEAGGSAPSKESLSGFAAAVEEVRLGEDALCKRPLSTVRGMATGGSTSVYFAIVQAPPVETLRQLGIDIAADVDAVRKELSIAPLPDELLSPQTRRVKDAALSLGHSWGKRDMLIDASKCATGYSYEAKWRATSYVGDAVSSGATLITRATVNKVLVDGNRAIGVECRLRTGRWRSEVRRVYGSKVVLAAGEVGTPRILQQSGVRGIGHRGFYCNPGHPIYGLVPGLGGRDGFMGSTGTVFDTDIELGDANGHRFLHRMMMLGSKQFRHLFSYPETIGIGVKVKDGLAGTFSEDGRFHKTFDSHDRARLLKGKQEAIRILQAAGAKHIVDLGVSAAGRIGGLVRISEHLDRNLETEIRNLHVCDGSVIPDDMRGTPTLTVICLGRHLSRHLAAQC